MKSKTKIRSVVVNDSLGKDGMKIRTHVRCGAGAMTNPLYQGSGAEGSNPLFT